MDYGPEDKRDQVHVHANMQVGTKMDTNMQDGIQDRRRQLALKLIKTFFLISVWISLGLCGEITGPTMLDLKLRTHSNFEEVSSGLSGRGAGFFVGSVLGGVLVDKLTRFCDVILAVALIGNGGTTLGVPYTGNTDVMFAVTLCQGAAEGVVNVAGQKLVLDIWLDKAAGPLHVLHAGYGAGSFIIPLIANPFLAVTKKVTEKTTTQGANVTVLPGGVTMSTRIPTTTEIVVKDSRMEYAYLIAAAISGLVSIVFFGYQIVSRRSEQNTESTEKGDNVEKKELSFREMINPGTCAGGRVGYGIQIFLFLFLYYIQAQGVEAVGGKFVRAYAIKQLDFSEDDGSYVNSVFWVAFTVGRVTGLFTARFIPMRILIMLESGSCVIASTVLVIFGDKASAFWILVAAVGFCVGPLFPSGVGWANYHVEMTGIAITFLMLGGAISNLGYIRLTGYLFDHYGYATFVYMLLGVSIGCFTVTALMNVVGCQHKGRFDKSSTGEDLEISSIDVGNEQNLDNKGYEHENISD